MYLYKLQEQAETLAREFLEKAEAVEKRTSEIKGIDYRACRTMWISKTFVAVETEEDRMLQYYGGFEYIDKSLRMPIGPFTFYFLEDDQGCIERDSRIERIISQVFPEMDDETVQAAYRKLMAEYRRDHPKLEFQQIKDAVLESLSEEFGMDIDELTEIVSEA